MKTQTIFFCTNCDAQFPKWSGRCTECQQWGTVKEQAAESAAPSATQKKKQAVDAAIAGTTQSFADMQAQQNARMLTGISECDRVLGGGIVPGSLLLLGGDPGIGKSTLVAQLAASLKKQVLYVSGEESAQQIKMRLDRLALTQDQLHFLGETHVESICKTITEEQPALAIIDSIQTIASSLVESEPGSVSQIKACTTQLLECAKKSGIPILIIGHVTKGGELGGPKTLEHIVDGVFYLEGDRQQQFRLLRAVKNRFGSTNEIGVFVMREHGLKEVANPSELFLKERSEVPGSCMTAVTEGNRVFLVEVQALVNPTSFGYPQRKTSHYDTNRLNLLLAVLQRRLNLPFDQHDVYINVVGGVSFSEPAMDLAICAALVSALKDQAISTDTILWGEVGLGAEVRSVGRARERKEEATRFGLNAIIAPPDFKSVETALARLLQVNRSKK